MLRKNEARYSTFAPPYDRPLPNAERRRTPSPPGGYSAPKYSSYVPTFDRSLYAAERRRTPSPGPSAGYSSYDTYVPARSVSSFRETVPSSYRADSWRPERPYYNRSPTPERYDPVRSAPTEPWIRPTTWRAPDLPAWQDRKPAHTTQNETSWPKPQPQPPRRDTMDTMAQRMFEPSENWKQSHTAAPDFQDSSLKDRIYDRPHASVARGMRERSLERAPIRDNYSPPYVPGDRYRPYSPVPEYRDPVPTLAPRSDSYRPQYHDRDTWSSARLNTNVSLSNGVDGRTRDVRMASFSAHLPPRPEFADQAYVKSERSAGVGSPQTFSPRSPIASRMSLPDRGARGHGRSLSNSDRDLYRSVPQPAPRGSSPSDNRPRRRDLSWSTPPSSEASRNQRLDFSARQSPAHEPSSRDSLASTPRDDQSFSRAETPVLFDTTQKDTAVVVTLAPHDNETNDAHPMQPIATVDDGKEAAAPKETPVLHAPLETPQRPPAQGNNEEPSRPSSPAQEAVAHDKSTPLPEVPAENVKLTLLDVAVSVSLPEAISGDDHEPETSKHDDVTRSPVAPSREGTTAVAEPLSEAAQPVPPVSPPPLIDGLTNVDDDTQPAPVVDANATESEEELPPTPEMKPLSEALRMIVMMRLQRDRQTQEERVNPVLLANLSVAEAPSSQPSLNPEALIQEVTDGHNLETRKAGLADTKTSLQVRFAQRQADLNQKVRRLREEYLALHERWLAHCAKLDQVAKAGALEEAVATAGRTTRRSAATLGDAVRSDLEMEQIIASLGNEELTDANHLAARNAATIPDMVSVAHGHDHLFDDTNNLVDDPVSFYAPRTGVHDWSEEETTVYLERFAQTPKQFGIIADYLEHKTPAQCVAFYYLHKKKHIDFRKVVAHYASGKRKRGNRGTGKRKSNALLTDIRRRDDEVSRDSTPGGSNGRRRRPAPQPTAEPRRPPAIRRATSQLEQTPGSTPTPDPEIEPRKKRRRVVTVRAAAFQEQEANDDQADLDPQPAKRGRKGRKSRGAEIPPAAPSSIVYDDYTLLTPETRFIDQTELTSRKKATAANTNWSEEDKCLFLTLLAQYGDDFKRIAASMPNKTTIQVNMFYKANLAEMDLERVAASAPKRSPTPEQARDVWKETSFPGSGVLTPSTGHAATPPEGIQVNLNGLSMETRFRVNGRASPSRRGHNQDAPNSRPSSAASSSQGGNSIQFRATTVESMRAQYNPQADQRARSFAHVQTLPRGSQIVDMYADPAMPLMGDAPMSHLHMPMSIEHIAEPSPFATYAAPSVAPATLTTTFPSMFPYTNLSPSNFASDGAGSSAFRVAPESVVFDGMKPDMQGGVTSTIRLDPFMHTKPMAQTWGGHQPLQTTDDLVAYLEHRTRLAGQQ